MRRALALGALFALAGCHGPDDPGGGHHDGGAVALHDGGSGGGGSGSDGGPSGGGGSGSDGGPSGDGGSDGGSGLRQPVCGPAGCGFADPLVYPLPSVPEQVALGDFNDDGFADLAIGAGEGVTVRLADGQGGFAAGTLYPALAGQRGAGVAALDVDGDGTLDLVQAQTQTLALLHGLGNGQFAPAGTLIPADPLHGYALPLAVADLNGDQRPDLYFIGPSLLGRGMRVVSFLALATGGLSEPITDDRNDDYVYGLGRFDGDAWPDLVLGQTATWPWKLVIASGQGNGTFASAPAGTAQPLSSSLTQLVPALTDFDGDGDLDLVYVGDYGPVLFRSDGQGNLAPPFTGKGPTGQSVIFASGDFDGDQRMDLLVERLVNGSDATLWLGSGGGDFAAATPLPHPVGQATVNPTYLATADYDDDQRLDLVSIDPQAGLRLLHGDGLGHFAALELDGCGVLAAQLLDVDDDGHADAVVRSSCHDLHVLPGRADGSLGAAYRLRVPNALVQLTRADLDGDGQADLLAIDAGHQLWWRRGGAGPAADWIAVAGIPSDRGYSQLFFGDLDGDGHGDLLLLANGGLTVDSALGHGDGSFAAPRHAYIADAAVTAVSGGFTDRDGGRLLITLDQGNTVTTLRGNGDGTFVATATSSTGYVVLASAGDFNGDGVLDLIGRFIPATPGNNVASRMGLPGGGFAATSAVLGASNSDTIVVADFDGDGLSDVLFATAQGSQPSPWQLWRGQPVAPQLWDSYTNLGQIRLSDSGDIDGDGRPDLVGLIGSQAVAVSRNRFQ